MEEQGSNHGGGEAGGGSILVNVGEWRSKAPTMVGVGEVEVEFVLMLGKGGARLCKRVGFPPLGYPPRHRSQDRSKPPPTHNIPLGWDAVDPRGAELLLFWPGARAT